MRGTFRAEGAFRADISGRENESPFSLPSAEEMGGRLAGGAAGEDDKVTVKGPSEAGAEAGALL